MSSRQKRNSPLLILFLMLAMWCVVVSAQEKSKVQEGKMLVDPFGKKAVLGYLLRLPVLLDIASVELESTETQKDSLAQIVISEEAELNELYHLSSSYSAELYEKRYNQILQNTDTKLKKLLSPMQYVTLRDWIIDQWALERGEAAPPLDKIIKLDTHRIDFLKSQLGLSLQDREKISSVLAQYKKKVLPLRRKVVNLAQNPLITWKELETEGGKIVQDIKMLREKYDESIMESLSPKQRVIYQTIKIK